MEKVLKERKDIAFYILLFPLAMHKDAYWKSKSIVCNRSLKMLEDAFAKKEIPKPECDTKEIDTNMKVAESLGITGTPALVLPDGRVHTGMMQAKQLIDFINGVPKPKPESK
jgi:thiol:disulfide interchange protein DsbC